MMKKSIILVVLALLLLVGAASANINTINIVVQDASYNPISGATISLTVPGYATYTRTTGADGKPTTAFSGYNVASPTTASITISKTGYTTYTSTADTFMEKTSTPGYTYTYTYPLSAPTNTAITITVKDSVNYATIPGAVVSIPSATPTSLTTDNTGKTGTFMVPISGFTVQITKSGYQGYTATDGVIYMDTPQNLNFYIVANVAPTPTPEPEHALVSYTVRDAATTTGIGGAWIEIRDNTNTLVGSGTTTTGGTQPGGFIQYFTPIPSSYSIVVSKTGYQNYTHTYSSAPIDDSTVSISLTEVTPTPTPTPSGYSYISEYPPSQSDTYVKATSSAANGDEPEYPYMATDPTKSLTGAWTSSSWVSLRNSASNQRFHIDLGTAKVIKRIYYENGHSSGSNTATGVKTFTFYGSNTAGDFTDLTYGNNGNWVQITTSQSTFDQHTVTDIADPKYITLTNSNAYRYYAVKISDNWGNGVFMSIRRIELQSEGPAITPTPTPTPTPSTTPSLTSIQVQVKDSINYAIIPGATVLIGGTSLTTDNTGKTTTVQVSTSSSGYIVNITASGYQNYGCTDYVSYMSSTQTLTYYIVANVAPTPTSEPAHATVQFHVYDEGTSNGIGGAAFTIRDTSTNTVIGTGATNTGIYPGTYYHYFTPIPSSYSINVTKSGYQDYVFFYSSPPVDGSIQTIYLTPTVVTVNLDVKSASTGYLIQGASVGIYDPDHDVWRNGTASTGMVYFDSTGTNYDYPLFMGKNVTIAAWSEGYQYHSQNLTIFQPLYTLTLNLAPDSTLPTGDEYTVVFTVLSNQNKLPLNEITVTSGLGAIKLTNTGGAATFEHVPAGVITMFDFSGSGYLGASISSTGSAGQVVMRQVELVQVGATPTPTPTSGSVVNATGNADLNAKGQTFLEGWGDNAINNGTAIFTIVGLLFIRKAFM